MSTTIRNAAARRRRTDRRVILAGLDALEGRQLLTVGAIPQFATVDISGSNWTRYQVPTAKTAMMEQTSVVGIMPAANSGGSTVYGDNFQVYLKKGQIDDITLDVNPVFRRVQSSQSYLQNIMPINSSISVYDPQMNQITGDAHTNGDSEVAFEAPSDGWYYVRVGTNAYNPSTSTLAFDHGYYTAKIQPIGLDATPDAQLDPNHNAADAAKLEFVGGALDAVLNGRTATNANGGVSATGTSVSFVGPTGRGFTIDGNWTESTDRNTWVATYSGSNLSLEMADPTNPGHLIKVPLSIGGATGLKVTMAPETANDAQGLFGQVTGTQFTVGNIPFAAQAGSNASISSAISTLAGAFGESVDLSKYGASLAASNNISWGISLGAAASNNTDGMPANPAVPYIWFGADGGNQASATFGHVSASVGQGYGLTAMIDPADPSFRLSVSGLPVVGTIALGGSVNGLIPYEPEDTNLPADKTLAGGTLYGDLYFRGGLDLAALTEEEVPINLEGDVVFNLDPMHLGLNKIAGTLKAAFASLLTANPTVGLSPSDAMALLNDLKQVSFGVNGTASLSLSIKGVDLEAEVAGASLAWNGMSQNLTFAGGSVNPLEGTPVSFLTANSSIEATGSVNLSTQAFAFDFDGNYGMLGQSLANADVNVAGNFGSAASVMFTVTGTSNLHTSVGNTNSVGFTGDATNKVQFSVDGSGNGSFAASGSVSVIGGVSGHTASQSGSYSFSQSGNIKDIILAEVTSIENTFTAFGLTIENKLTNLYSSATGSIVNAWNKFTSLF